MYFDSPRKRCSVCKKTAEFCKCILGIDFLVVPCSSGKESETQPIYCYHVNVNGECSARWQCPHCGKKYHRRKPCESHMGLKTNTPTSCSVLIALDEKRRVERKGII